MKRIFRTLTVALTLTALFLAGCGSGGKTDTTALTNTQNSQADAISAMTAQLSTMQATLKAAQLAQLQAAIDASNADTATKASITAIITAAGTTPTVSSITAQITAAITAAVAGTASQASVNAILVTVLGHGSAITAVQTSLASVQIAVTGLQTVQSTTSAQVAAMQSVIDADQATITGLLAQIATLNAEIAPLAGFLGQIDASTNIGTWGSAPIGGTQTVYASNVFGPLAGKTVTIYATGGATLAKGGAAPTTGPITIVLDSNGQGAFDIEIADGSLGQFWVTIPTNSGIATSTAAVIGHVITPLSRGFAPGSVITWDLPPVVIGPVTNRELTAHFPVSVTGPMTFSVDNGGVVTPIHVSISSTGEASTLLTTSGADTYTVTATLDAVAPVGLAMSRQARAMASGRHILAGGTTLTGSVTISTAAVAWQQSITPASGFTSNQTMNVVANAGGVYTAYIDAGATNQSRIQKRDGNGNLILTIPVGAGTEQIQQNCLETDGTLLYIGTNNNIYAFDGNGNQVWKVPTSYPTVVRYGNSKLYIGNNNAPSGHILTLDATNGNQLFDLNTGLYPNDISVAGDIYVVGTLAPGATDIGAQRINASTQAITWTQTVAAGGYGYSISATAEGVYVSGRTNISNKNIWMKLALADGSTTWDNSAATMTSPGVYSPTIYQIFANEAGVFVNSSLGVKKFDYDGTLNWTVASSTAPGLYIYGQQVYWTGQSSTGRINNIP
jgi:hypothetical protein